MFRATRRGRVTALAWAAGGTLVCMALSAALALALFGGASGAVFGRALVLALVVPVLTVAPLLYMLSTTRRALTLARHRLAALAARDDLTHCLKRDAFAASVDAWLSERDASGSAPSGAMLVIDADHFNRIQEQFGHHEGDVALKLIAAAIRSVLRGEDRIGRTGKEQFCVFLPGASADQAEKIAERIRRTILDISFAPGGDSCRLTVSVGCAAFDDSVRFDALFQQADAQLFEAKSRGRNRVARSPGAETLAAPHAATLH